MNSDIKFFNSLEEKEIKKKKKLKKCCFLLKADRVYWVSFSGPDTLKKLIDRQQHIISRAEPAQ